MGPQVSAFLERSVVAEAALIHLGLVRLVRLRLDNMAAVVVVRQLVLCVKPARERDKQGCYGTFLARSNNYLA